MLRVLRSVGSTVVDLDGWMYAGGYPATATATQIQAEALTSLTPLPTISIDEVLRVFDYDADATGRY